MASNVPITAGVGTSIATDDVGGNHYQRIKVDLGGAGAASPLVRGQQTAANSIPIVTASDDPLTTVIYTEAATDATITGVPVLWEDTSDTLRAVSAAKPFPVNIVAGGGSGGTSLADDADFTPLTTLMTPIGGVYESAPTSVTDGDIGMAGLTQARSLKVSVAESTIDVAHDAVDTANPVKVGSKAANALPTPVANNDRANAISDLFGRILLAHIDPAMQGWRSARFTTTQTGGVIWDPAAGKRIAITHYVIGTGGTTAGRLILWFGATADSTYTAATDQLVHDAEYAPSATVRPGTVVTLATPIYCTTADHELKATTDANLTVGIAAYGYEY